MEFKKKIRDTIRVIKRSHINQEQRLELLRKLNALVHDLEEDTRSKIEKKNRLRYKMVKFFEKNKALRKIKRKEDDGISDFWYIMVSSNFIICEFNDLFSSFSPVQSNIYLCTKKIGKKFQI